MLDTPLKLLEFPNNLTLLKENPAIADVVNYIKVEQNNWDNNPCFNCISEKAIDKNHVILNFLENLC